LAACTPNDPVAAPSQPAPAPVPTTAHVANPDVRGFTDQPDYNRQALTIRTRVGPKLPAKMPSVDDACGAMLTEAAAFYRAVESEVAIREQVDGHLTATHDQELARCKAQLSPDAALCVTLLLEERDTEYPWLVDQCIRAFPRV